MMRRGWCGPRGAHLSFGHQIGSNGHVLEEDGEVESVVTFSVCDGGIGSVPQQLDHHGEVALPPHAHRPHSFVDQPRTEQQTARALMRAGFTLWPNEEAWSSGLLRAGRLWRL